MKTIKIITMSAVLCIAFVAAQAQTNFSGKWKRNADQSDAGGLSTNSVPITVEINQDNSVFTFHSVVKDGKGELHPQDDTLKLNGAQKMTINAESKNKRTASAQWSADKKHLIYRVTSTDTSGKVLQDWKHDISLTAEGHLEIDVDLNFEGADYTMKQVFDKA
jgi:hypothetical protein